MKLFQFEKRAKISKKRSAVGLPIDRRQIRIPIIGPAIGDRALTTGAHVGERVQNVRQNVGRPAFLDIGDVVVRPVDAPLLEIRADDIPSAEAQSAAFPARRKAADR